MIKKKLQLNRLTVANLNRQEERSVFGGSVNGPRCIGTEETGCNHLTCLNTCEVSCGGTCLYTCANCPPTGGGSLDSCDPAYCEGDTESICNHRCGITN